MSITLHDCTILYGRGMSVQGRNPALAGRVLIGGSKPGAGSIRYLMLPEGRSSTTPFPAPPPAGAVVSNALLIVSTMPGNAHPL